MTTLLEQRFVVSMKTGGQDSISTLGLPIDLKALTFLNGPNEFGVQTQIQFR